MLRSHRLYGLHESQVVELGSSHYEGLRALQSALATGVQAVYLKILCRRALLASQTSKYGLKPDFVTIKKGQKINPNASHLFPGF
jgi:hypothetical protein